MAGFPTPPVQSDFLDKVSGKITAIWVDWFARMKVYIDAFTGMFAPIEATYITQTPSTTLTNEQSLSSLATGFVKVTTTTGILSSTTSLSDGLVTATDTLTPITLANRFSFLNNAKDFGALGDGITDDKTALGLADTAGPIVLSEGTYLINTSMSFTNPVTFLPGAKLSIASGQVVTFSNILYAGIQQIFSGSGTVSISHQYTSVGYPEWWGAVTNTGTDCLAAINSCIAAVPKTQLQAADYSISDTLVLAYNNKELCGYYGVYDALIPQTRIIIQSASVDCLHIGKLVDPGGINSFAQGIIVKNIDFTRDRAVTPPGIGSEINGAAGVRVRFALRCYLENLRSTEHTLGFLYYDCVDIHSTNLKTFRSLAGNSATNDIFWGYWLAGVGTYRIQSCYWTDCGAELGILTLSYTVGYVITESFTDIFLLRPEANAFTYGLVADGAGASYCYDGHIVGGVFDQCTDICMIVRNMPTTTTLSIVDTYLAPSLTATKGGYFYNSTGQVSLTNNQVICYGGATAYPLYFDTVSNITSTGNMVIDAATGMLATSTNNCRFGIEFHNTTQACSTAAVVLTTSTKNKIDCMVKADTAKFPYGVNLTNSSCTYNEINASVIDQSAVTTAKLRYNGGNITDIQMFGTGNIVDGVISTAQNNVFPNNISFNTATAGVWNGTVITTTYGGTGLASYAQGDLVYYDTGTTFTKLAKNASATRYLSNQGTSNNPSWNQINLANGVTGTLPVGNGGSGVTSLGDLTRVSDTNVTLTLGGTPTGALITSASITAGWSGTLAVSRGGTGTGSAGITAFNNITGYTAAGATGTTSTNLVFSTSPTLVTPLLGTPTSGVLTNCSGTAASLTAGNTQSISSAVGTTAVGNATAGNIGEYISATGAGVTQGTSGQFTNVCSISLTAGDWDVSSCLTMNIATSVLNSYWSIASSAYSANTTTDHVLGDNWLAGQAATGNADAALTIASWRVNVNSTTTIYLKGEASWATAAPTYYGRISARRVR